MTVTASVPDDAVSQFRLCVMVWQNKFTEIAANIAAKTTPRPLKSGIDMNNDYNALPVGIAGLGYFVRNGEGDSSRG